jgi:AraC-like DNA-binding protein
MNDREETLAMERTTIRKKVEQTLEMMRVYLMECVSHDDWADHRADEMARTLGAWLCHSSVELRQAVPDPTSKLPWHVFRHAVRFVHDNLDTKLKWEEIATEVGLDPFTFGRGFKQSAGMTPHQYVIRCRLRRAMMLLASDDLTLADIALEVGCSCQSHLTTLFRKHLGTTPGAFRMSLRQRGQRTPHSPCVYAAPAIRWEVPAAGRSSLTPVGTQAP